MSGSPAPSFRIDAAGPEDCDVLTALAIRSKAHWGYSESFMAACRDELAVTPERLRESGYHCFVARNKGRVLGFYAIEIREGAQREGDTGPGGDSAVELEAMFVEPAAMRGGIGRSLMRHARAAAGRLGATRLLIQADPHAVPFYRAEGAVPIGSRPSASVPGRALSLLELALQNARPAAPAATTRRPP